MKRSVVVLTHRRPRLAARTVRWLVAEGFAPEEILLVVNGDGGLDDEDLERQVHTVNLGANLGPAGGFAEGLRLAAAEPDAEWIYLLEDDACLLGLPNGHHDRVLEDLSVLDVQSVGVIASFGRRLDPRTGRSSIIRPGPDEVFACCEVAAWGASFIAADVVREGVVPDPRLFFGYEDFDFMMRVAATGRRVLVHAPTARALAGSTSDEGRRQAFAGERATDGEEPWRLYYQARNFVVFARRHGGLSWQLDHLLRSVRRWQLAGGGLANGKAILLGLLHGFIGRLGPSMRYSRTVGEYAK